MRANNPIHTKPIRIIQLNLNRSNKITHTLLNSAAGEYDIALVQEPWFNNIGNDTLGPVAHQCWTPILPTLPIPEGNQPRVMAYTSRSRDDYSVILRLDLAKNYDFQILEVKQG